MTITMVMPRSRLSAVSRSMISRLRARIQVARRLVGQQHGGLGDDGPRDGDPLLLAAGELGGRVVFPALETHGRERRGAPRLALAAPARPGRAAAAPRSPAPRCGSAG